MRPYPQHRPQLLLLAAALALANVASIAPPAAAQGSDIDRQLVAARDTIWHAWFANDTALLR
ncbi:MAG TPA: hypothetical protein VET66_11700, partial [Steroidobacteraceae bacterium]|nr:hypothetical protein [Steroidobacteraceae bacterium]